MPKKNPNNIPKKWNYVVTFEHTNDAPQSIRGVVEGSNFPAAAQRAIKDARRQLPRLRADSVCVVIERNNGTNDFKV
jgi:hypothetical protein